MHAIGSRCKSSFHSTFFGSTRSAELSIFTLPEPAASFSGVVNEDIVAFQGGAEEREWGLQKSALCPSPVEIARWVRVPNNGMPCELSFT